ncbi:MAG TPA: hypothetical protein VI279_12030 [Rhodocyclaceae bacterium]
MIPLSEAANEIYQLILAGNIAEAQQRCRAALDADANNQAIELLYAKSLQFAGDEVAALRAYLKLAVTLQSAMPRAAAEFVDSVIKSLGEVFVAICSRASTDPGYRSKDAILACYEVVIAQLACKELLVPLDALLVFAIILMDQREQGALMVTANTLLKKAEPTRDTQYVMFKEMTNRGIVSLPLLKLGATQALRSLRLNRFNLLALWTLLNYAYQNQRYGLIERALARVRRQIAPQFFKYVNQYYMLRTGARFFQQRVIPQNAGVSYLDFCPAAAKRSTVFLISCDEVYFRRAASSLVGQLMSDGDHLSLHLNVVDPTPATRAELAAWARENPSFGFSTLMSTAVPRFKAEQQNDFESLKTLYACSRFLVLPDILNHYGSTVVVLDSDQCVVGSMAEFVEQFSRRFRHDFAVTLGPRLGPGIDYYADLLAFANSLSANIYAVLLRKYIAYYLSQDYHFWTLDQVALLAVHAYMRSIGHELKLYELDSDDLQTSSYLSHYGGADLRHQPPAAAA